MNLIEKLFDKLSNSHNGDDNTKYIYILEIVTILLYVGIHSFLLIYFLLISNTMFATINTFVLIFFGACTFLINKNKFKLVGYLLTIEIYLHTVIMMWHFGAESAFYFYFFILIFTQLTLPYTNLKVRLFFVALYWITLQFFFISDITPIFVISGTPLTVLKLFNINSAVIGVLATMYIDTLTKKAISNHHLRQIEEYKHKANYDNLTKIGNRNYADKIFKLLQSKVSNQDHVIAMMDLDDFKAINDTFGHSFGDVILETIAQKTLKTLRSTDYIFRWGGEEFLIVLTDISPESAYVILDRIRHNIQEMVFVNEHGENVNTTVTIGFSKLDIENIQSGIDECDKNMYKGKLAQKNIVCCNEQNSPKCNKEDIN